MNEHVDPRLAIGANAPPLLDQLNISEAALVAQVQEIADRANALPRKLTPETAEADIAVIGAVVRDAGALARVVEKRRVVVKQPWLDGATTVDEFFTGGLRKRLGRIEAGFTTLVSLYREEQRQEAARKAAEEQRKANEARIAAEAQERKLREEAEAAAAKGRAASAKLAKERADEAARTAQVQAMQADVSAAAAVAAAAPPVAPVKAAVAPDLTMSAKAEWVGKVVDRAQIDFAVLGPYFKASEIEDALKRAVKNGVRACRGAEIKIAESVSFR